jgi:hypothetical protein
VSGGIVQLFLNLGTRRGCVVSITPRRLYPRERLGTIVQGAGWKPEPVWIGVKNLAPPGLDYRTFHPVTSRYTNYTISAPQTRSMAS